MRTFTVLLALGLVAMAVAVSHSPKRQRNRSDRSSDEHPSRVERRRRPLGTRRQRENFAGELTPVEKCAVCVLGWKEALTPVEMINFDGGDENQRLRIGGSRPETQSVITPEKTCRAICPRDVVEQLKDTEREERDSITCLACKKSVDNWRRATSKRQLYQSAKYLMCGKYADVSVRHDCAHIVNIYAYDVHAALRDGQSAETICSSLNLCNRVDRQTLSIDMEGIDSSKLMADLEPAEESSVEN